MCYSGSLTLSSNQWKCVYRETMFDLDKCFTDVNKAGERDGGEQMRLERGEKSWKGPRADEKQVKR